MSEQAEATNDEANDQQPDNSALRKKLEEALAENKELRKEKRHRTYAEANLPDGAYDVFDQLYDGDLTVDSLQEFAKSKGFALPSDEQPEATDAENGNQPDPAQQRQQGEDRLSQLNQGAIPARDPSINDQLAEAEAKGDWATVDVLNAQKLNAARQQIGG